MQNQTSQHIDVLLFDAFSNHCLANAVEPLRAANDLSEQVLYTWSFLTLDGRPVASSSGLPVTPASKLAGTPGGDALLVMPSYGFRRFETPATARALRAAAQRYDQLIGMDTGAWLMAAAGLLDGTTATIHWDEIESFRERFVEVDVVEDRFVQGARHATCGGAATAFELVLDTIRREHGVDLMVEVRALFMQGSQPDRDHLPFGTHGIAGAAADLMRRNLETGLSVAALARALGTNSKALERATRSEFSLGPAALYRKIRLAEARRLLRGPMSVAEIATRCGYADPSALTRAFRRQYGKSCSTYRRGRG